MAKKLSRAMRVLIEFAYPTLLVRRVTPMSVTPLLPENSLKPAGAAGRTSQNPRARSDEPSTTPVMSHPYSRF
jgi:hypothetical protein